MKKVILLLLTLLPLMAVAQKIQRHYVVREDGEGTIHHLMPATLFEAAGYGELTYDITWRDNRTGEPQPATLNFTYYAREAQPADSLAVRGERINLCLACQKLYIDPENRTWKHRYSLSVAIDEINHLYEEETPEILLYTPRGEIRFTPKRSAWQNYCPIGRRIFQTIELNRR